jgi:hypothetical protein
MRPTQPAAILTRVGAGHGPAEDVENLDRKTDFGAWLAVDCGLLLIDDA